MAREQAVYVYWDEHLKEKNEIINILVDGVQVEDEQLIHLLWNEI